LNAGDIISLASRRKRKEFSGSGEIPVNEKI